jgi:hypothetical protein
MALRASGVAAVVGPGTPMPEVVEEFVRAGSRRAVHEST